MISALIFRDSMHVAPCEMMGVGVHRFDFYVLRGASLMKYSVMGGGYVEAIQTFCFRFQLKLKSRKKFSNNGIVAYRLYLRDRMNMKVCDDCVVKMVF